MLLLQECSVNLTGQEVTKVPSEHVLNMAELRQGLGEVLSVTELLQGLELLVKTLGGLCFDEFRGVGGSAGIMVVSADSSGSEVVAAWLGGSWVCSDSLGHKLDPSTCDEGMSGSASEGLDVR